MAWQEILSYIAHKWSNLTLRDQALKRKVIDEQISLLNITHFRQETR
jgi:hypothetical protein